MYYALIAVIILLITIVAMLLKRKPKPKTVVHEYEDVQPVYVTRYRHPHYFHPRHRHGTKHIILGPGGIGPSWTWGK